VIYLLRVEAKTYYLSRVWAWGLVGVAVAAGGIFIWAGWGRGSLMGLSGMPLRLGATFVAIAAVIVLRLVHVMAATPELLHFDERGIFGREPSGDLWASAIDYQVSWDQLAAVDVVGSVIQRVVLSDRHAVTHTVVITMVAGLGAADGAVLADEIRTAYAAWRGAADE